MTLQELREKREQLVQDMRKLVGADGAFPTAEARVTFDRMKAEYETLGQEADDLARSEYLTAAERSTLPETQRQEEDRREGDTPELAEQRAKYRGAMISYLRDGLQMMNPDDVRTLRSGYHEFDKDEKRALSAIGGAAGGFTVMPDMQFAQRIVEAQKFFGGLEAAGIEVITTDTGAELPFPTNDDTSNTGEIVAESGSHASGTDLSFGLKILRAFLYSTKIVLVPWQLLQDSAIDIEAYLAAKFGMRLGRIQNTHGTTGTGANQPEGLMTAITVGRQAATGNTTSWPFDDVFRVIHALDVAWRNPRCKWMMRDATILALRLAKDGSGRYLWPELGSVQAGQPLTLGGYQIAVNNDVAAMAASAKAASFGDHSYYKKRLVRGYTVVRLGELYAASGQVGFMAFSRMDAGYVSPGQDPIVAFQNSAT